MGESQRYQATVDELMVQSRKSVLKPSMWALGGA